VNDLELKLIDGKELESEKEIIKGYEALPETVRSLISFMVIDELNGIVGLAESCQSPIEQLLGIALNQKMDKILKIYTVNYFLLPQETIKTNNNTYRVDFLARVHYEGKAHDFVIECDGHEFHQKTKEQVKKDKKRDRDLTMEGYTVIRFTGSEIVQSPFLCARETIQIITNKLNGKG
jgi:very-short-patch-repair endonuclease